MWCGVADVDHFQSTWNGRDRPFQENSCQQMDLGSTENKKGSLWLIKKSPSDTTRLSWVSVRDWSEIPLAVFLSLNRSLENRLGDPLEIRRVAIVYLKKANMWSSWNTQHVPCNSYITDSDYQEWKRVEDIILQKELTCLYKGQSHKTQPGFCSIRATRASQVSN